MVAARIRIAWLVVSAGCLWLPGLTVAAAKPSREAAALLKKGQQNLERGDAGAALASFSHVVERDWSDAVPEKELPSLLIAAWRGVAGASARLGQPSKAAALYERHGGDGVSRTIERAAAGRAEGETYRLLLALDPTSPIACEWREKIGGGATPGGDQPSCPTPEIVAHREAVGRLERRQYDEAVRGFARVIERIPGRELARFSARLLLEALNAQRKTKELSEWLDRFAATRGLMKDRHFRDEVTSLRTNVLAASGLAQQQAGSYAECGRSFVAAADGMPGHARHPEFLWNAGLCFEQAGMEAEARQVRQALMRLHPKNDLATRVKALAIP
jgi:tetratricopeptide (TPR) repeat protein